MDARSTERPAGVSAVANSTASRMGNPVPTEASDARVGVLPKRPRVRRFVAALVVALASDAIGIPLELAWPLVVVLDVVTALVLWLLLGRGWLLLVALLLEVIPGFGVVPFWTLAVIGEEKLISTAQARLSRFRGAVPQVGSPRS